MLTRKRVSQVLFSKRVISSRGWGCLFFFAAVALAWGSVAVASESVNLNVMPPSLLPPVNLADEPSNANPATNNTPPPDMYRAPSQLVPVTPTQAPVVPAPTYPALGNQNNFNSQAYVSPTTRAILQQIKQMAWGNSPGNVPPEMATTSPPPSIPQQPAQQMQNMQLPPMPVMNELPPANSWQNVAPPSPAQVQPYGYGSTGTQQPPTAPFTPPVTQQPQPQAFVPSVATQSPHSSDSASGRVIEPGDLLDVRLINEADVNLQTRVGEDGFVTLPFLGNVKVSGLSLGDANHLITEKYTAFYRDPVLSLIIVDREFNKFSILGHVSKPGVYEIPQSRSSISLMEAIAMASGTGQFGDVGKLSDIGQITIRRLVDGRPKELPPINGKSLEQPGVASQYQIQPGDTVIVQLASKEFFMLGEVRSPGVYKLPSMQSSIELMEAIAMAGGAARVADIGKVIIKRRVGSEEKVIQLDAEALGRNQKGSCPIYAGDTVVVELKRSDYVVLGQVARPGKFEIPPLLDSIDLLEALAAAGGPTRLADLNSVKVRRFENGKEDVIEVNVKRLMNSKEPHPFMVTAGDRIIVGERWF